MNAELNLMVKDFNDRCGNFQHYVGDLQTAKSEAEALLLATGIRAVDGAGYLHGQ